MKLVQNQWAKDEKEFWLLSLVKKIELLLFYLLILFIPTQFGKHFWPNFSYVLGQRIDYLSPTIYVTDILLASLFLLICLKRKITISPLFSLFVLFLGINIFTSHFPANGWYFFLKFLEVSFFVWYVANRDKNTAVGVLLAIGMVFEVFVAVWQMLLQHSIGGVFYFLGERSFSALTPGIANASLAGQLFLRPYATFSHPNIFAGYIVVTSFIILYLFYKKNSLLMKTFLFFSLLIGAVGIVISLSRVAIVIELLGILFLINKNLGNFIKTIAVSFVGVGIFILLFSMFFPEIIFRFLPSSFGQSITERVQLANDAILMTKTSPLFGIGFGNFIPFLPYVSLDDNILQPVHNIFLLVMSELGIIGVTIFISFLWGICKKLFIQIITVDKEQKITLSYLLLALGAIIFSGLFDHYWLTIQQGQLLFGLVIGLCLKAIRTAHDTIRE